MKTVLSLIVCLVFAIGAFAAEPYLPPVSSAPDPIEKRIAALEAVDARLAAIEKRLAALETRFTAPVVVVAPESTPAYGVSPTTYSTTSTCSGPGCQQLQQTGWYPGRFLFGRGR